MSKQLDTCVYCTHFYDIRDNGTGKCELSEKTTCHCLGTCRNFEAYSPLVDKP